MSATYSHLRGWRSGVQVEFNPDGKTDQWDVYMTCGSYGGKRVRIGTVIESDDGPRWEPRDTNEIMELTHG